MTYARAVLIAAFLAGACRGEPTSPDAPVPLIVWHGATVEEQADGERLWRETAACVGVREDLLAPLDVTVVSGGFKCGEVWAAGCTSSPPLRVTVARDWFAYALPHEYINAILMKRGHLFVGTPDNPYGDNYTGTALAHCDPNAH